MVADMNVDFGIFRQDFGRLRDLGMEKVLEFNGLWQDECYRNWFDSEVEK
jgi:hypothetical protein